MFAAGLQFEEIDHIDESDLQVGELATEEIGSRQRFLCGDVSG